MALRITDRILDAFGLTTKALTADTFPLDLLAAPTLAGVSVTPESALGVPAVSNAVSLISGALASLPLEIFREENGGKVSATDHSAYGLVYERPNDWTSSADLRKQLTIDALLHGDGFALANRLPSGEVFELIRAMPGSITVLYDTATSEPVYRWQPQSGGASTLDGRAQISAVSHAPSRDYHWSDVIHVSAPLSVNGITGVSPIQAAREAIALAIVLEQYAARLFGSGARPSGVLTMDGKLDDISKQKVRDSWNAGHAGGNSGRTALLDNGIKFSQLSLTSVDAQFLEMRNFAIVEIARAFGVNPILLGDMGRATFSNSSEMSRQFLTFTLRPWMRNFEGAFARVLIDSEERKAYSVEFDDAELLRADDATRAEYVGKLRAAGVLTANEARLMERLPRHASGDELTNPYVQSGATPRKKEAA